MSSNRLMYDTCAYKKRLDESTGPLAYHLNPMKYENCSKCRIDLGIIGGPSVSHIKGNLVDLENNLRGQCHPLSKCPTKQYNPLKSLYNTKVEGENRDIIDTDLIHLPSCQMFRYKPVPLPDKIKLENCPAPQVNSPNSCQMAPPQVNCGQYK